MMDSKNFKTSKKMGISQSFIKLLQLELKTNYKNWVVYIMTGAITISIFEWTYGKYDSFFSFLIFILSTNLFTFYIFSESNKNQMTTQYRLIPVHLNIKFFTKLIFSFMTFPLLLAALTIAVLELCILITEPVTPKSWLLFSNQLPSLFLAVLFLSLSISMLLGIIFKREKTMYAISVYFGLVLISLPFWTIVGLSDFKSSEAANHFFSQLTFLLLAISLSLLVFSYFLFKRRQL